MSTPSQGGSYIRRKDGTLDRVAFTARRSDTEAAAVSTEKPAVTVEPPVGDRTPRTNAKG